MTFVRRPRVFLSYRHQEPHGWIGAKSYNAKHRAWVANFAKSLASWNIDVVWDDRLRDLFRNASIVDPGKIPFLAEVSTLCLQVTQTFMPILTHGYFERIKGADGGIGYGTVSEEWRHGTGEYAAGRAEIVAIVREWPIAGCSEVPAPIASHNAWDYRFVEPVRDEVELLADVLNGVWDVERPRIDMPFRDWIHLYLQYCTQVLGLPWPGVEHWGCDFDRPRIFLSLMNEEAAKRTVDPDSGSQRDLQEWFGEPQTRTPPARFQAPEEPQTSDRDKAADSIEFVRSVITEHALEFRKPFDFSDARPGGRGSKGLYFGKTRRGFSHLHPADPNHPG